MSCDPAPLIVTTDSRAPASVATADNTQHRVSNHHVRDRRGSNAVARTHGRHAERARRRGMRGHGQLPPPPPPQHSLSRHKQTDCCWAVNYIFSVSLHVCAGVSVCITQCVWLCIWLSVSVDGWVTLCNPQSHTRFAAPQSIAPTLVWVRRPWWEGKDARNGALGFALQFTSSAIMSRSPPPPSLLFPVLVATSG